MSVVIDASLALAWVLPDEATEPLIATLEAIGEMTISAPSHWPTEVANALVMAERRGQTDLRTTGNAIALFENLAIEIDFEGGTTAFTRALPLARAHKLSVYDALYLELAERRGSSLGTLDGDLRAAAATVGISVFP